MKKIVILGSTGHIGSQALEIIRAFPKEFKVVGLSANSNKNLLEEQIKEFHPIKTSLGGKDLIKVATLKEADLVVVAVVGLAGLEPTLAAIKAKKNIALATKEVLVVGGPIVINEVKKNKVKLIPIDSEHGAIFQCLQKGRQKEIKKIFLTMGKGRFASMSQKELAKIKLKDIYKKPTWIMGGKITIDSATCVNKSFEVIEARWLFNLPPEKIEVIVHPEYICHSMVEFKDGSIIAELGSKDMKRYIQYALFYPERKEMKVTSSIDLYNKRLSFEPPPFEKFPGLELGYQALQSGGTMPAVLHGADDSAVSAFVEDKIDFLDIPQVIKKTMKKHQVIKNPSLQEIIQAENWARDYTKGLILNFKHE